MGELGCGCLIWIIIVILLFCGLAYIFGWFAAMLFPIIIIVICILLVVWLIDIIVKLLKNLWD